MVPGTSTTLNALLAFIEGDRWGGIPSITITVNGVPYGSPVASAKMQFRLTKDNAPPLLELSTGAGTIQITDAANWRLTVPSQNLSLTEGVYFWAFQTTDQGGGIQTYLEGTIPVKPKVIH